MADKSLWSEAFRFSLGNWRISILLLIPGAVALEVFHAHPVAIFAVAAVLVGLTVVLAGIVIVWKMVKKSKGA